jgi:hypothetical protein
MSNAVRRLNRPRSADRLGRRSSLFEKFPPDAAELKAWRKHAQARETAFRLNRASQILPERFWRPRKGFLRRLDPLGFDRPTVAEHLFQVPQRGGLEGPAKNRLLDET